MEKKVIKLRKNDVYFTSNGSNVNMETILACHKKDGKALVKTKRGWEEARFFVQRIIGLYGIRKKFLFFFWRIERV